MHNNIIKEDLSVCYLKTIAAVNGIELERMRYDSNSDDVVIKKVVNTRRGRFYSEIKVQLKSTSINLIDGIKNNQILYPLNVKNYNDLCTPASAPRFLMLFILPKDNWIEYKNNKLAINGTMYWLSFKGVTPSNNKSSVTIKIPVENIITPTTIQELMQRAAEGEMV